jgi:hypothetical protein
MSLICYEFTIFVITNTSLICTAGALNPHGHYVSGMDPGQLNALRTAFERMTDLETAAVALSGRKLFVQRIVLSQAPSLIKWQLMAKRRLVCIFFNFISLQLMY